MRCGLPESEWRDAGFSDGFTRNLNSPNDLAGGQSAASPMSDRTTDAAALEGVGLGDARANRILDEPADQERGERCVLPFGRVRDIAGDAKELRPPGEIERLQGRGRPASRAQP